MQWEPSLWNILSQQWTWMTLASLAIYFLIGAIKKAIGGFIVKQAWNILKHFNPTIMQKTQSLIETIGHSDAYSVALETV